MRILADENVAGEIVEALRRQGHDVSSVLANAPGSPDAEVLRRAGDQARLVLTFDKDFGELAFRARIPASPGVILLRLMASSPALLATRVASALGSRDDWEGHFSVVEADRVRMTPLP